MDHKTLSDLIGLIYDSAFDIRHWPRLAEMLIEELAPALSDSDVADNACHSPLDKGTGIIRRYPECIQFDRAPSDNRSCGALPHADLARLLHSHFDRALKMNRRMSEIRNENNAIQSFLDRLPLAILIADRQGRVIAHNSKLNQFLSDENGLCIRQGVLSAHSSTDTARLKKSILRVAQKKCLEGEAFRLNRSDSTASMSVLILPFFLDDFKEEESSGKVFVLAATPQMPVEVNAETLISLYQFTMAEAKLVASLVRDRSLNFIAEDFGVSKHTIRNQLKSIYEKTGTHRQAELVRQVITGPAMLAALCRKECSTIPMNQTFEGLYRPQHKLTRSRQIMNLPDGRRLCFAEYGAVDGRPVILMHASNGSRLERHPDETIIEKCGIRLIIPDRPGVGLSDMKQPMTFGAYARDVACLADHLKLDRFNMIGYSLGGAYALGCAYWLKGRVGQVALAASVAPFDNLSDLEGMYLPCRLLVIFGRYAPILAKPLARFVGYQVRPESYPEELWRHLPPVDQVLVSDAAIRDRIIESARENQRQGDDHVIHGIYMISRHWGFELDQIKIPVNIWHGELDQVVPPKMALKITRSLPNSTIRFLPGAGHYLLFHCWKEILLSSILP